MRELLHLHGLTPQNKRNAKWFERDEGDSRLAHDRKLIASKYPDLKYGLNYRHRIVFLCGQIVLKEEGSGIPTRISTKIVFRDAYPKVEPFAIETSNLFKHVADRHFYPNGICCLWLAPESQWNGEDESGLLGFLDQVAVFFERQLIYDASGGEAWPWGERSHSEKGYIEYIQEKLGVDSEKLQIFLPLITSKAALDKKSRCPCGSRRPYQFCHLQTVIELTALASKIIVKENLND